MLGNKPDAANIGTRSRPADHDNAQGRWNAAEGRYQRLSRSKGDTFAGMPPVTAGSGRRAPAQGRAHPTSETPPAQTSTRPTRRGAAAGSSRDSAAGSRYCGEEKHAGSSSLVEVRIESKFRDRATKSLSWIARSGFRGSCRASVGETVNAAWPRLESRCAEVGWAATWNQLQPPAAGATSTYWSGLIDGLRRVTLLFPSNTAMKLARQNRHQDQGDYGKRANQPLDLQALAG